jgi:hypothetical protein
MKGLKGSAGRGSHFFERVTKLFEYEPSTGIRLHFQSVGKKAKDRMFGLSFPLHDAQDLIANGFLKVRRVKV